jgi:hypothetical protein
LNLKAKGDLAELKVAVDLLQRGHKIAIPYGEDCDFDLVLIRGERLERVQVKHTRSTTQLPIAATTCSQRSSAKAARPSSSGSPPLVTVSRSERGQPSNTLIPDDGASRIRTGDLSDANRTLCQLSYGPARQV